MTRSPTRRLVWTWYCDRCGRGSEDLAWEQGGLPRPDEMRKRGWYIAPKWGDLCPDCAVKFPGWYRSWDE
ncbi:hypothetical protein GCM10009785_21800 [Brooklawnia cerclae]|uniref:Uncharacterized protein n=1 Tax=Brooklawnia cerclae TaxID=349934 RepID=A0ABX0SH71_9ACTN|nr:hypothetical protein [Brooklawnia cerclae]